jgi:predicted PurR-regulated permease PerM
MRRSASVKSLLFYGLSGPIIALNIWLISQFYQLFQHPITILIVAAILAFLLNYPVKFFERARITRTQAVTIVLLAALTLFVILGVTLVPIVVDQTIQLLNKIPGLLSSSQANLQQFEALARQRRLPLDLRVVSNQINVSIQNVVQQLASSAVGVAGTLLSGLLNIVLIVVLAFYMLLYGDRVWSGMVNLLPSNIRVPLITSLRLNFHNFFLSQLLLGPVYDSLSHPDFLDSPGAVCFVVCHTYWHLRTNSLYWCVSWYRFGDDFGTAAKLVASNSSRNSGDFLAAD